MMQEGANRFIFTNISNKAAAIGGIFKTENGQLRETTVLHLGENNKQTKLKVLDVRALDEDSIGFQFDNSFIDIKLSEYGEINVFAIDTESKSMVGIGFGGVLATINLEDITANDVLNHLNTYLNLL